MDPQKIEEGAGKVVFVAGWPWLVSVDSFLTVVYDTLTHSQLQSRPKSSLILQLI
jgi:hypothetical protein